MQTPINPAPRVADLSGKRIGLYWNMKAGGDVALDRTAELLRQRFPGTTFTHHKGSVGWVMRHATADDVRKVARECDAVVGTTAEVTGVDVSGATVALTLSPPVAAGQTVTFDYVPPGSGKVRDAAANNAVALDGVAATNGSAFVPTPLGYARYSLYFDPADHGFLNGDVLNADITPRVGASVLTPGASPVYSAAGLSGGPCLDLSTGNAHLKANGYTSLLDGHDKVVSGAICFQRVGNESGVLLGWGRNSTDQYFEAGFNSSGRWCS